jgi:hypothetical protein
MNTTSSTFDVSNVSRATEPLLEVPYHKAIDWLLSQHFRLKKQQLREQIGWSERRAGHLREDGNDSLKQLKQELAVLEARETTATRSVEV